VEGDERLPQLLRVWPRVSGVAKRGAFLDLIGTYKRRSLPFSSLQHKSVRFYNTSRSILRSTPVASRSFDVSIDLEVHATQEQVGSDAKRNSVSDRSFQPNSGIHPFSVLAGTSCKRRL
jgi:hypothetical protein